MQFSSFGVLTLSGFEVKHALSKAMTLQLVQILFSQYIVHAHEKKSVLDTRKSTFCILFYIPAIIKLWMDGWMVMDLNSVASEWSQ